MASGDADENHNVQRFHCASVELKGEELGSLRRALKQFVRSRAALEHFADALRDFTGLEEAFTGLSVRAVTHRRGDDSQEGLVSHRGSALVYGDLLSVTAQVTAIPAHCGCGAVTRCRSRQFAAGWTKLPLCRAWAIIGWRIRIVIDVDTP